MARASRAAVWARWGAQVLQGRCLQQSRVQPAKQRWQELVIHAEAVAAAAAPGTT